MTKANPKSKQTRKAVPGPSGKRLALARQQAGFSEKTQAARRYGWTVTTYISHESGQADPVPLNPALEYGKAFGVDGLWIVSGRPDLAPPWYHEGMEDKEPAPVRPVPKRARTVAKVGTESIAAGLVIEHEGATAVLDPPTEPRRRERPHFVKVDPPMSTRGDGHQILDLSSAAGELRQFLDQHMTGPKRQLWQVDSDAINLHIPEGSYVVVDTAAKPERRALVLAQLETPEGPVDLFGALTPQNLIFASTAVKTPPLIPRTEALKIIGPIVAAWPHPK